jgi:vacuolar protein sorting-associated protein 45
VGIANASYDHTTAMASALGSGSSSVSSMGAPKNALNAPAFSLDAIYAVRNYVTRMVNNCPGMKVMLLDSVTTQIVSAVYSQTEILKQHVYLVQRIDERRTGSGSQQQQQSNDQQHLKAIVFVRPTPNSVEMIARELEENPRHEAYHIYFSGILPTGLLRKLADADAAHGRVESVHEYYADYMPINPDLITLQSLSSLAMTVSAGTSWAPKYAAQYERHVHGIQSMLLSLRRQPRIVRYAGSSPCAEELAREIADCLAEEAFQFRQASSSARPNAPGSNPLLLILDRRDDPVTPLLSQWTYQAMVHELLGLNNHRVSLRGAPNIPPDLEQVVLQDDFFHANKFKNFGELGDEIQKLLSDYQRQTASSHFNLNSIEEMQQFMDKFPELRSRSHVVSKHVAIMGELARLVQACSLMDVSQLEQELAISDDHNSHWRELLARLNHPDIKIPDKLRLGLLYALKYETSGNLHMLQSAMSRGGVPPDLVELVPTLLRYGGRQSRGPGLFQTNLMSKMSSLISSVQGVDNVYTQHVPLLMETIQAAARGKLSAKTHPILVPGNGGGGGMNGASQSSLSSELAESIPSEIFVFMVGGVTYEEAAKVSEWNSLTGTSWRPSVGPPLSSPTLSGSSSPKNVPVLLAGSTIHNSTSFLEELRQTSV